MVLQTSEKSASIPSLRDMLMAPQENNWRAAAESLKRPESKLQEILTSIKEKDLTRSVNPEHYADMVTHT